jgi:hypothetical protein
VTPMVAIFSFSEAAEGTSPRSSGMMASDYRFTPNVSIVEGSYGRPRRMGRYRFHRHRWLICWKELTGEILNSHGGRRAPAETNNIRLRAFFWYCKSSGS